jgi:uncharacterized protein (DUF1778 family)
MPNSFLPSACRFEVAEDCEQPRVRWAAGARLPAFVFAVQVPYNAGVASRTKRIEMRADAESEALIVEAAAAQRVSVSAFVLEAAAREASRVLGRADLTPMPAEQFDAFVDALGSADAAPRLAAAADAGRRYQRR